MEQLNFNKLLDREQLSNNIKTFLIDFENNKNNLLIKRSIYLFGSPGSGKTQFITEILKELNYDIIKYDAGDIRNKNIIDTITRHNMSDRNVISMFHKKIKKIAIIMDEIDGMNNGDKGGINSLIKLIRPKKTKKQKNEEITYNPIICISNYHMDKKIKELMKVCHTIELNSPSNNQIKNMLTLSMPDIDIQLHNNIITFIQGDLRKLYSIYNIYNDLFNATFLPPAFHIASYVRKVYVFYSTLDGLCIPIQIYV
jgi:Cdc6-like AAA superfamily ATPase